MQVTSVNINIINSSADEDAETRVARCEKVATIQKSNGLANLEKEMVISVSNKTSPCYFRIPHTCLIYRVYIYRNLLNLSHLRNRIDSNERILHVKIPNHKNMILQYKYVFKHVHIFFCLINF